MASSRSLFSPARKDKDKKCDANPDSLDGVGS